MIKNSMIVGVVLALSLILSVPIETIGDDTPGNLYQVTLDSYRDAEIVRNSGVDVLLRGYNQYLVIGDEEAIDRIVNGGVRCEIVHSAFDPSKWVIAVSENRRIDLKSETLSLATGDRILFGDELLVKREAGKLLQQPANGVMLIELPRFDIPVRYEVVQLAPLQLQDLELIDSLVSLISMDSIESYVRRLEAFVSRHSDSDSIMAARDWIAEKFEAYGLDVSFDPYHPTWSNPVHDPSYNVVADHPGATAPETYIVVGAHYDATSSGNPRVIAPGADDNASGTAFCVEFARILQDFETPKAIRFICFSGEEQQLVGSGAYVDDHSGVNIEIMINADMIANNSGGNTVIRILHNSPSRPYALLFEESMDLYTDLVADIGGGNSGRSDHAPFEQAGYSAVFVHEARFSPFYHSPSDIADNLDFVYMTEVVKGCVATAYQIAFAPPVIRDITITDMGTGDHLLVEWTDANDSRDFEYKIRVGTSPGIYTRFHYVAKTETSFVIDELTEGTEYFISVGTVIDETSESIINPTGSALPYSLPFAPTNITASPGLRAIDLEWERSIHPDVVEYLVLRSISGENDFDTVAVRDNDKLTDSGVLQESYYDYYIVAMDVDSNYSVPTDTVTSRGLFFNRNALVVVDVTPWAVDSSMSLSKYRYFFSDIRYDLVTFLGGLPESDLPIEELGQYKSVFWFSDLSSNLSNEMDDLGWFADWGGDIFIGGYTPVVSLFQDTQDWFGLTDYTEPDITDFVYSEGEPFWPDAIVDSTVNSYYNNFGDDRQLKLVPWVEFDHDVSTPAYRYVSSDPGSQSDGQVCGLYTVKDSVAMMYLGLPLFHMKLDSGRGIINAVAALMGVPRDVAGDINDDTRQSLLDIILMIKILYAGGGMQGDVNRLDVNNDCVFDILDLLHLIAYIYLGGEAPTYGCAGSQ
ncbi:MAG: M28 family peptidase [Candidatus Zixiibacteriota bacterium]